MTKEEILLKIGERIAELSHNASQICEEYEGYRLACMDISDLLDEIEKELSQPSLPSNLDEAAEISDLEAKNLAGDYTKFLAEGLTQNEPRPIGPRWMKKLASDRFKAGAEWMAGQGVSLSHLIAWYIQSVDAHEPVWTEEHLEELVKDYILIPKN